jgi:hypothetical protein
VAKKLNILAVFLVAGFGSLLAQNTITNSGGNISCQNGFWAYANIAPKGYVDFYTGPVSLPYGGSFSGGGAYFWYSVPNLGSGKTQNVSGTLLLTSTSTKGSNTLYSYALTLNFSGYDSNGQPFTGTSTQLITMKTSNGGSSTVAIVGGTTTITLE